jgi:ribosomal-protein-alanine N-acetyltransferase
LLIIEGLFVNYRLFVPEDFNSLYAIEELCFKAPFRFGRRMMRKLVSRLNAATWIAEDAGQMAGFAIVEWTRDKTAIRAYIQTIEVVPEQRGCGVGRDLLARLEASAQAAEAGLIWLHADATNAGALRLYEAHGYECHGRQENYYPFGRAALVYVKRFDPASKFDK